MDTKPDTEAEGNAPFLRFLNEDRCKKVHEATLELLERTGVWIGDPECLEMLCGAGARVVEKVAQKDSDYNTRVQIPAHFETLTKEFIVDSGQRAQQRAIEIIESHKPEAISPSAVEDLAEVTKRWHGG